VTVHRIKEFFNSPANREVLNELLTYVSPEEYNPDVGEAFQDQTIVFTGSLPSFTRNEASEIIELQGGNVTSSVSGKTDILVVGKNPGQRKQEQGQQKGVQIMSGKEFEEMIQKRS